MKKTDTPISNTGVNSIVFGTEINGEIKSPGNFRVDGKVNGNVFIEGRLIVGEKGLIEGDVKCQSADIEGVFRGNIHVDEILSLKSKSQIYGDANFGKLKVEEGAQLSCSCNIRKSPSNNLPKGKSITTAEKPKAAVV